MKKLILFFCGLLLFSQIDLLAQEEAQLGVQKAFVFSIGMGNIKRQDLNFSPMIHQKWSPINVNIMFTKSKKFEQQAYLKFGLYQPIIGSPFDFTSAFNEEDNTTGPHVFTLVDINYSLGKAVIVKDDFKFTVGGRWRNRLQPSSYLFGNAGSFGYYISLGLDVWLNLQYDLNERNQFVVNAGIPLFSYTARSPYKSQNDEYFADSYNHKPFATLINYIQRGDLESWGTSQIFDFDVNYHYQLSEKWDIGMSYWLSMNFNQRPLPFNSIENVFYLTGRLNF